MPKFRIEKWGVDVECLTPEEAALAAARLQLRRRLTPICVLAAWAAWLGMIVLYSGVPNGWKETIRDMAWAAYPALLVWALLRIPSKAHPR